MRTLIALAFLTLPHSAPDEITQLDDCIHKRFLDRKAFGMSRILPQQYHGVRTFRPENATEQAIVNQLEQKGYQVALFLAGRNVQVPISGLAPARYAVQGPAYITHIPNPQELPPADQLLEESRAAFRAFDKSEAYDLHQGDWTIAFRPLRASNAACVQCHNSRSAPNVKIGDPLGVVMYVYRR